MKRKFDLSKGDLVLAEDSVCGGMWKWQVKQVYPNIFVAVRVDGKGGERAFRNIDYEYGFIEGVQGQ